MHDPIPPRRGPTPRGRQPVGHEPVIYHEETVEEPVPMARALIGATIVALIGAVVWGLVIAGLEIEIGWLAWGIGWLVGFTYYKLGGVGGAGTLACGVLALVSIFGGKYIGASMLLSQAEDQINEFMGSFEGLAQAAIEEHQGRGGFGGDSGSDEPEGDQDLEAAAEALFGALGGESGDDSYDEADDEDWDEWDEWAEEDLEFDPEMMLAAAREAGSFEFESPIGAWTIVKESLGFIDVLFMLLGVGTALAVANGNFRF